MKNCLISILGLATCAQLAVGAVAVSSPVQSSASAAGNSFNPVFSADGHHLVFVSHANNLVTNDDLGLSLDVFVRDLVNSNTVLVSVNTNGFGGANADANYPSISSNGQFIAFASRASNLVSNDTNGASDVFVRDVVNGTTRLISMDTNGHSPIDPAPLLNIPLSGHPLISADGRWVFFESRATNLIAGGALLDSVNIYARDTWSNVTVLATMAPDGLPVTGRCHLASISLNGRYAAFIATNIEAAPQSSVPTVYVRDMAGGTAWAGYMPTSSGTIEKCEHAALSENGQLLVFTTSVSSNAVIAYALNEGGGRIVLSLFATNTPLSISGDGARIAFEKFGHVYVIDPRFGEPSFGELFSITNVSARPTLSRDGQALAYVEASSSGAARWHLLLRTSSTNVVPISVSMTGILSTADFFLSTVALNSNGSLVAFDSTANDLVSDDLNGASDIFLRDVNAGVTELITRAQPAKPAATAFTHSFLGLNSISSDGRFVVTLRYDDPSAFRDTNGWQDVFLSDALNGMSVPVSISSNAYLTNFDGGAGPTVTSIENTNAYLSPVISADGSVVYATRRAPLGQTRIFGVTRSNALAGTGMAVASRGINVSEDRDSYAPSVSSNGMLLVFTSTSKDLVEGISDPRFDADVFVRRTILLTNGLFSGSNEWISLSLSGPMAGNGASSNAFVSPDGRWVIFDSRATDLITNNAGSVPKLLARDLHLNVTHLASVGPNGSSQWGYVPASAAISGNSRYVAFSSGNIYLTVHDLLTRTSVIAENPVAVSPSLSYDGRFVAFVKQTFNSLPDQIYVRDLQASQSDLVSANQAGVTANGTSSSPLVSGDGRYVVFQSKASDLIANDANGVSDIFVRDRLLGATMLVSANPQGLSGNGPSSRPVLAADARTVVFQSFANDLVGGDYNDKRDVFVLKLGGADTDGDGMDDDWEVAYFGNQSRDGSGDLDDDGVSDLQEFRAGTDPTNIDSVFRVLTVTPMGGGSTRVMWTGNPNRNYRVEFKDELSASNWRAVGGTISWNGSTASIGDTTATNSTHRYYRALRLP